MRTRHVIFKRWLCAAALASVANTGCEVQPADTAATPIDPAADPQKGRDPGTFAASNPTDSGTYLPPGAELTGWAYNLQYSEVIVSPAGDILFAQVPVPGPDAGFSAPGLVLLAHHLATGQSELLSEYTNLRRITFSVDGTLAYLLHEDGRSLSVLALDTLTQAGQIALSAPFDALTVTDDGRHLVLSNLPRGAVSQVLYDADPTVCVATDGRGRVHNRCRIDIVALTETGTKATQTATISHSGAARDIDVLDAGKRIAVTWSTGGLKGARVSLYSIAELLADTNKRGAVGVTIAVPSCADELVVVPGGGTALLSPTSCGQEPISVIDLVAGKLVATLPGFGPVQVSANGAIAVGFARSKPYLKGPPAEQPTDISLLIVSLADMSFRLHPWGKTVPALTIAPDAKHLYAHDRIALSDGSVTQGKFVQIALQPAGKAPSAKSGKPGEQAIVGGAKTMDRFAWSADGKSLYLLSNGALYRIPSGLPVATHVSLPGAPELLNLRPQQDMLILGEANAPVFYLVDLHTAHSVQSLVLTAATVPAP